MQLEGDKYRIVAFTNAVISAQLFFGKAVNKEEIHRFYTPPFVDGIETPEDEFNRIFDLCKECFPMLNKNQSYFVVLYTADDNGNIIADENNFKKMAYTS